MQSAIFQAFICYNFDDYGLQLIRNPNSADLTVVQKSIIDILHKEGKPQKVIEIEIERYY